jgi:hypothetical protein
MTKTCHNVQGLNRQGKLLRSRDSLRSLVIGGPFGAVLVMEWPTTGPGCRLE